MRRIAPLLAALLAACSSDAGERRIVLAHGLPTTHPVHAAMEHLAVRAAELSEGALRVDIHPAEQLGTERECLELLQIGSVGMTKVSASVLESFVPEMAVFSLPYLFRDEAHQRAVLDGPIGAELLRGGERVRLRGLAFYDAGSRSFYTARRPVRTPEDLAGLKIRTQESPSAIRMVQALGGSATPIAWGELYTSLQQGVVDGAENNPPSFHLSRHYEVARFYALDEHTATPDVLIVGTRLWDALTPDERAALEAAATESVALQRSLWAEATQRAMTAVAGAGVEVSRPDKEPFARAVAPLYDAIREEDPPLHALVERVRAVR